MFYDNYTKILLNTDLNDKLTINKQKTAQISDYRVKIAVTLN